MFRWAKSSLGSRSGCLGPSGGSEPPAGIMLGKEPRALLGSALALPNDGDGNHRSSSPAALRGLGAEAGSGTFPPGSSLRSPPLS